MDKLEIGKRYYIHSYKHDGTLHRQWDEAVLLDICDEYLVFGNDETTVTESDGRTWRTKESAVLYFYKNKWFNIIGQNKKDGIYYYCNMASPFIIEDNTIKYIDYDIDLRVFSDGNYRVLDKWEYNLHKERMHYSKSIDKILKNELKDLMILYKGKKEAFNVENINKYLEIYKKIQKKSKKTKKSVDNTI